MPKLQPAEWKSRVPRALKELPHWVGWDEKKRPVDLRTQRLARVSDPASWGTWEAAQAHYEREQRRPRAGCGFVFSRATAPLVFVDVDHCLGEDSQLEGWASELLRPFLNSTYCERSPGGSGLHLFCRAELSAPGERSGVRRKVGGGAVEVYWDRRYSTVTGDQMYQDLGVEDMRAEVEALVAALGGAGSEDADGTEQEEADPGELLLALGSISPDCSYEEWLRVGMALKSCLGKDGFKVWDEWSAAGSKYRGSGECAGKWRSFRGSGVGAGSLFKLARAGGWDDRHSAAADFAPATAGSGGDPGSPSPPAGVEPGDQYERGSLHAWRAAGLHLVEVGSGKSATIRPSEGGANVGLWLQNHPTCGRLRLNERTQEVELSGRAVDLHELTRAAVHFCGWRRSPSEEVVQQAVRAVAARDPYDPVAEWLRALPPHDGRRRLGAEGGLCRDLGLEDGAVAERKLMRWMVGAVARALEPGCRMQNMLVLWGEQGRRKSEVFRRLAVREEWYGESEVDMGSKDGQLALLGPWVVEWGELSGMSRHEVERVKVFISESTSRFRRPYGRRVEAHPRRAVLAGTTNREEVLRDATGSRRFWLVQVPEGDLRLEAVAPGAVEQLWSEALALYLAGERWWDEGEEVRELSRANERHYEASALDNWVEALLPELAQKGATTMVEVVARLSERHRLGPTVRQRDIGDAMRRCGWNLSRLRVEGEMRRLWVPPGATAETSREAQVLAFRRSSAPEFSPETPGTNGATHGKIQASQDSLLCETPETPETHE